MTTRWTARRIAAGIGRRAKRLTHPRPESAASRSHKVTEAEGRPREARGPDISVILPIYNVEAYLAECLDSIVSQSHRDLEIIVVDDGSPDGSRDIAERYASDDDRIRVVTRENGGLGAARNTGVTHASGEYLTFVDSDDKLPAGALSTMLTSARHSGSDLVVGSVRRFRSDRTWKPAWVDALHTEPRTGITIDEFPDLVRNNYTWCKLYRRDFWTEQGIAFREGVSYEDQPLVTQLYIAAAQIDVVPDVVYLYRQREDASSISQQTASLKDLRDRIAAWRVSRDEFSATASQVVYDAWLKTLFDAHFHWYLRSPGTSDLEYWVALREAIVDLTDDAPAWIWESTAPEHRVPIELARRNRRVDVQEFVRREGSAPHRFPAKVVDDGVRHELPFHDDPDLDPSLFVRRPGQLVLSHSVQRFSWVDGATMRLSGWAYIRYVDLVGRDSTTTLILRNRRTGRQHEVVTANDADPGYPAPDGDDWIDYSGGEFEAVVAMDDVVGEDRRDGDVWEVRLRVETAGFTVEDVVRRIRRSSSAGVPEAGELPDGDLLTVAWQLNAPFQLVLRTPRVEAVDTRLVGRTLHGRLTGPQADEARFVELVGPGQASARARVESEGAFAIDTPALGVDPARPARPRRARAVAELASGEVVPLARRGAAAIDDVQLLDRTALAVECSRVNELGVAEWRAAAYAHTMEVLSDGVARISGRIYAPEATTIAVRLASGRTEIAGKAVPLDGSAFVAEIDLSYQAYRFGRMPLPHGNYEMSVEVGVTGADETLTIPLLVSRELSSTLPLPVVTNRLEGRIERGARNMVRLALVPPLGAAAGRCRQNRLRAASGAQVTTGQRRGLLIRTYAGQSAADSGLAVHRELRRRGAEIDIYWAVEDHSIPVPEGATPVIENSFEWYGLLNTVRYYLDNSYQPDYHNKPEGQVIIQTLHGYPFKTMGRPLWEQRQVSRAQIDSYTARAGDWDYLVSPASYATPLLTRDFGYDGEVLEIGYPRNDILLDPRAGRIRADVRRSLGIQDHQSAVLYAPTLRDHLSPDDPAARFGLFDFEEAAAALGEEYVLLVRGYAPDPRASNQVRERAGVIDVTGYPVASDLYLAADAAVVDYSSLRFDFGVTGKPMIFCVPDLDEYKTTRGWLCDFEPTAPGPLVTTTGEVIDALRDLDVVTAKYKDAYSTFRHAYLHLEDGRAAARLVDRVFAARGDAPAA